MRNMSDKEALADIRKGGKTGYGVIFKRYAPTLRYHLMGKYGIRSEDVDDLLQEIFLKFYKSIPAFKEKCSVATWLYKQIIPGVVADWFKKIKNKPEGNPGLPPDDKDGQENDDAQKELECQICIEQVFEKLKRDKSKSLLYDCLKDLMKQAQGRSIQEIAKEIGRTPGATSTYFSTCKQRLSLYTPLQECWKYLND